MSAAPIRWRSAAIAEPVRYRLLILAATACMSGWNSAAFCDDGLSDDFSPPILHAPALATSVHIPPAVATAGVAYTSPAFGAASHAVRRALPCSSTNPCAIVTPATDSVLPTH